MAHPKGYCGRLVSLLFVGGVLAVSACTESTPDPGVLCFQLDNGDGTTLITCDNGLDVIVANGPAGREGQTCGVIDNANGTATIACEDGSTFIVNDGRDGSSCSVATDEAGNTLIVCTDGSEGTITDGVDGDECTVTTDAVRRRVAIACTDGTTATVEFGEDGGDCSVSRNAGTGVISIDCVGGGATVVDGEQGGSCSVGEDETGTVTITCADGTTEVVIQGTRQIGSVTGRAFLLAMPNHSGIRVSVLGTPLVTTTGLDGSYSLDGVPRGTRTLEFSSAPWQPETVRVPIQPGTYEVPDVTLRLAQRVWSGQDAHLLTECGPDGVLLMSDAPALAELIEDRAPEPDIFDPGSMTGRLQRWRGGVLTTVAPRAAAFRSGQGAGGQFMLCSPDGSGVFFSTAVRAGFFEPETGDFSVWSEALGSAMALPFLELPEFVGFSPDSNYLAISGSGDLGPGLWLIDLSAGSTVRLATDSVSVAWSDTGNSLTFGAFAGPGVSFHVPGVGTTNDAAGLEFSYLPDSDLVLYESPAQTLVLRDAVSGTSDELSSIARSFTALVGPDGAYVVLLEAGEDGPDTLMAWDVVARARVEGFAPPAGPTFAVAAGGLVAYTEDGVLRVWDLAAGAATTFSLDLGDTELELFFSPDGELLGVNHPSGAFVGEPQADLLHYDAAGASVQEFAPDSASFLVQPNGGGIAYRLIADGPSAPNRYVVSPSAEGDAYYSPEGRTLISASSNPGVVLWRLGDGSNVLLTSNNEDGGADYQNENTVFVVDAVTFDNTFRTTVTRHDLRVHIIDVARTLPVELRTTGASVTEADFSSGEEALGHIATSDFRYPDFLDDGLFVLFPF